MTIGAPDLSEETLLFARQLGVTHLKVNAGEFMDERQRGPVQRSRGMKRLIEMVPSEANGLNFCQDTVAEMGVDVIEAIRYFGSRGKIHHVHFRNIRGAIPRFDESFIDDGDVDMLEAMRAYIADCGG